MRPVSPGGMYPASVRCCVWDLPRGESGGWSGASRERAGHFLSRVPGVTDSRLVLSFLSAFGFLLPTLGRHDLTPSRAGAYSLQNTCVAFCLCCLCLNWFVSCPVRTTPWVPERCPEAADGEMQAALNCQETLSQMFSWRRCQNLGIYERKLQGD